MISRLLDTLSNYLAHRKGLLPIIGIVFILLNLLLAFMVTTNLFLHLGLVIAILGLMLAWAL
jgi:hypothetical protein